MTAPTNSPVRLPCGSVRLRVNGEAVTLRPSGALWLEQHQTLVVADLHLEKGSAYAARGQMLPPYDSRATLDRLEAEIEALRVRHVVRRARDDAARGRRGRGAVPVHRRHDWR